MFKTGRIDPIDVTQYRLVFRWIKNGKNGLQNAFGLTLIISTYQDPNTYIMYILDSNLVKRIQ